MDRIEDICRETFKHIQMSEAFNFAVKRLSKELRDEDYVRNATEEIKRILLAEAKKVNLSPTIRFGKVDTNHKDYGKHTLPPFWGIAEEKPGIKVYPDEHPDRALCPEIVMLPDVGLYRFGLNIFKFGDIEGGTQSEVLLDLNLSTEVPLDYLAYGQRTLEMIKRLQNTTGMHD